MDVGIGLPSSLPGTGRDQLLEWARRADARGFSTLGTIDRIVYPSHDPLIALSAVAGVTERIVLNATGPQTVRLLPPLIVTREEIEDALARVGRLLAASLA